MLRKNTRCRKSDKVSFCQESTLISVRMFPNREQGEHRQMRRSEDFLEEQDTRFIIEEQPGQEIEDFRKPR